VRLHGPRGPSFDTGVLPESNRIAFRGAKSAAAAKSMPGANAADILLASPGDDVLRGFLGNDQITGGHGHDTLRGTPSKLSRAVRTVPAWRLR
jgi:Ca2+-binding RTX toxin-like protein